MASNVDANISRAGLLRSGLRFRFSDASFLRLRMQGNTRATVIGGSSLRLNPQPFLLRIRLRSSATPLSRALSSHLVPPPSPPPSLFRDLGFSISPSSARLIGPADLYLHHCRSSLSLSLFSRNSTRIGGSVTVPLQGLSVYRMIRDSVELNVPMAVDGLLRGNRVHVSSLRGS